MTLFGTVKYLNATVGIWGTSEFLKVVSSLSHNHIISD